LKFYNNIDLYKNLFKSSYGNIYKLNKLFINKNRKLFGNFSSSLYTKIFKALNFQELSLFRRYKLKFNLNKYKFQENFLYLLSSLISRYYNKKVEFNIVNMKSIVLNSDIFTYILTRKLKNKKANIIRMMNSILNRAVLPEVNRIREKSPIIKSVDHSLLENKYKNTNINYALNSLLFEENNFDLLLNQNYKNILLENNNKDSTNKFYNKIYEIIFNSIKYKNMGGVRLEVSGRLTKRYRADRALYKVR
jgi:hypothetical protein